jgi:hypothetical protein
LLAVRTLLPAPIEVTTPESLTLATKPLVELHAALPVKSSVLWSVKVPVALTCAVDPSCTVTPANAIESSCAALTVSVADPDTEPEVAVITAEPCVFEVARPDPLIVATEGLADVQLTELLMSPVLESEYVPVALNWTVSPAATDVGLAFTAMDCSVLCGLLVPDELPPEHAVRSERTKATNKKQKR